MCLVGFGTIDNSEIQIAHNEWQARGMNLHCACNPVTSIYFVRILSGSEPTVHKFFKQQLNCLFSYQNRFTTTIALFATFFLCVRQNMYVCTCNSNRSLSVTDYGVKNQNNFQ